MLIGIWVVDVNVFVFQVFERRDVCVGMCDNSEWFWVDREYCVQVFECVCVREFGGVVIGVVLLVRLCNVEFQFVFVDGVDVVDRVIGGFYGVVYVVFFVVFVYQMVDCVVSWIVNVGYVVGVDGDEVFCEGSWCGQGQCDSGCGSSCEF